MAVSFATFERLKDKGVAAYKTGNYSVARTYLIEAAECLIEMAGRAKSEQVRRQHEQLAQELVDLAKDCDRQQRAPGGRRARVPEKEGEGTSAGDWIVRDKPNIGFDDIAGLDDVKQEIRLKMIYPFSHPELAKRYGISTGGGVLLHGPPGTGKTMMAKAIAHELDATFFVVSAAEMLSKWVGEAEQNIKKLFDAAKAEDKSVIFIDEIEALVPRRKSDSSTVMQRVVPQILQELEGFDRAAHRPLLFVGATNKPWLLDDAIMRPGRFDARVYVGLPDAPARFKLLEIRWPTTSTSAPSATGWRATAERTSRASASGRRRFPSWRQSAGRSRGQSAWPTSWASSGRRRRRFERKISPAMRRSWSKAPETAEASLKRARLCNVVPAKPLLQLT
jgi:transitional endoplasmic reticulum ATPase